MRYTDNNLICHDVFWDIGTFIHWSSDPKRSGFSDDINFDVSVCSHTSHLCWRHFKSLFFILFLYTCGQNSPESSSRSPWILHWHSSDLDTATDPEPSVLRSTQNFTVIILDQNLRLRHLNNICSAWRMFSVAVCKRTYVRCRPAVCRTGSGSFRTTRDNFMRLQGIQWDGITFRLRSARLLTCLLIKSDYLFKC